MEHLDYFRILGLNPGASLDDIKKAYRNKARQYHPDVNPSPDAEDMFIKVTEAYEFLIAHHGRIKSDEEAFREAMENWRKYRRQRSQNRAAAYARAPYDKFRKTRLYKTTKIFDGATIIFSFAISLMVIFYTVFGYIYRLRHPVPQLEPPSVTAFLLLLIMGLVFFSISLIYLLAWRQAMHKSKEENDQAV